MIRPIFSLLVLMLVLSVGLTKGQSADDRSSIPNVYLDCNRCDFNYIRTNIEFVNYVRDQDDADIYLRIIDSRTAGGREYSLNFRGLPPFSTRNDTLIYRSRDTYSSDEERAGLVRIMKVGLVPFASRTLALNNLNIFYDAPSEIEETVVVDPWNGWVFDINMSTSMSGRETEQTHVFHTGLYAERMSNQFKISARVRGDINRRELELTDRSISVNRDWGEYWGLYAYTLGDHASLGLYTRVNFHRPNNIQLNMEASPAIEYNFFPYSEYQERRFLIRYRITPSYVSYYNETIFFQESEYLLEQNLHTRLRYDRPWGRVDISINLSNYFHDTAINNVNFRPSLDVRIIRGLSLNLSGGYRIINNQIAIPLGEISDEDRLTGQVQQPTSYDYNVSVGFSYTFGSRYNNIVNPRF